VVASGPGGASAGVDQTFTTSDAGADAAAPTVRIAPPTCPSGVKGKACQTYLQSAPAWKTLRGTTNDPGAGASGVARVEVNLLRRAIGKCVVYAGDGFKTMACDRADDLWLTAALSGASWKLALRSLPRGTYTLRVRATDRAGNTLGAFRAGQSQLTLKLA
jgi:hypothetical protein